MESNGQGPFANIDVVTVVRGNQEINQNLAVGFKLLTVQIIDLGPAVKPPRPRFWPMAVMGRAFKRDEDMDRVREEASEAGEDTFSEAALTGDGDGQGEPRLAEPRPLVMTREEAPPPAPRGRPPGPRRVHQPGSVGVTETSGIRG